jgi:hypothetical protein
MSIKPFEQVIAELGTTVAINSGTPTTAQKYSRAQVALAVAAGFTAASQGDAAALASQIETAVLTKVTDPGEVKLVTDLFNTGNTFLAPLGAAGTSIPLISATVQGVAANIAAGITAIASAYKAPATT